MVLVGKNYFLSMAQVYVDRTTRSKEGELCQGGCSGCEDHCTSQIYPVSGASRNSSPGARTIGGREGIYTYPAV